MYLSRITHTEKQYESGRKAQINMTKGATSLGEFLARKEKNNEVARKHVSDFT